MSEPAHNLSVTADLAQIFEPIREDLDRVEQEFVRHIQSRVALIPEMGKYIQKSGGKRQRQPRSLPEQPSSKAGREGQRFQIIM